MKTQVSKILSDDGIMVIMGCIIALVSVVIFAIFSKKKNKKNDLCAESDNRKNKRKELNKKNVEFVGSIIKGHHTPMSAEKQNYFKILYAEWQELENKMSDEASPETIKKIKEFFKKGTRHEFYFLKAKIYSNLPDGGKELILKDVFTDPFPSLHDMDDWAICEKSTIVLTLKNVSVEDSKNYFIYIKQHFVNHNITTGIIMFDVYKIIKP